MLALGTSPAGARERHKPPHTEAEHVSKEPFGDIPKGPIEIFVSIDQQKLHLYSDGTHVADTSVATGVPALPTPLGVFSVIQKQVFHRSNIYSGAPMPFMQRITWSGVALHEGEDIGHRASHGCIRMPRDFAMRLYQLTRLGARVVVADSELKPSAFADPHLFVHKVVPPAAPPPVAAVAEPIRTAQAGDNGKTTDAVAAKPVAPPAADADAPVHDAAATEPVKTAPSSDDAKTSDAVEVHAIVAPAADASAPAQDAAAIEPVKTAPSRDGAKITEVVDTKSVVQPAADASAPAQAAAAAEPVTAAQPSDDAKSTETVSAKPDAPAAAVTDEQPRSPAAQTLPDTKTAATALPSSDHLRGTDANPTLTVDAAVAEIPVPPAKPAEAIQSAADRKTPISVFVSRKEKRIYVRQNFEPMFDAAITIDHPEQPLGTHVFTALGYLDDGSTFRWDAVSLPGAPPKRSRIEASDARSGRHGKGRREDVFAEKPAGELPPPQTPAEALARIEIPPDIVARISELMVPGSSLIVSDQGLGDETGEGTDFVVVTR